MHVFGYTGQDAFLLTQAVRIPQAVRIDLRSAPSHRNGGKELLLKGFTHTDLARAVLHTGKASAAARGYSLPLLILSALATSTYFSLEWLRDLRRLRSRLLLRSRRLSPSISCATENKQRTAVVRCVGSKN